MIRLSIDIGDDLHQFLKIHTAYKKETMVAFVREAIYQKVSSEKELNNESIECIENSQEGIEINSFNTAEDLYENLGIK